MSPSFDVFPAPPGSVSGLLHLHLSNRGLQHTYAHAQYISTRLCAPAKREEGQGRARTECASERMRKPAFLSSGTHWGRRARPRADRRALWALVAQGSHSLAKPPPTGRAARNGC